MEWVIAATLSAILFTIVAVLSKELMDHINAVNFTAIYSLTAFILYTPIFIYYLIQTEIQLSGIIALFILLSGIGNILGMLSYNYGLKHTSISIAMPLNRIQPVFVAIIGAIFLNEIMNLEKVVGIILVTIASYIILLENRHDPLDPITNLVHDYGAQLALVSAIFFSATSVIDRFVTTNIAPELYTYFILGIMAITLNIYLYNKKDHHKQTIINELTKYKKLYFIAGLLTAFAYLAVYTAFSQAEASKVVPVLQLQVPLTVVLGKTMFNETHILQKLLGAAILIVGIILVI